MKGTLKLALLAAVALTAFGLVASPAAADDNTCTGGHFQFCESSMSVQPLDDNPCLGDQWSFCS